MADRTCNGAKGFKIVVGVYTVLCGGKILVESCVVITKLLETFNGDKL